MKKAEKKREIWMVWHGNEDENGKSKDRIVWTGSEKGARRIVRKIMGDMPEGRYVRIMKEVEAYKK